MTALDAKPETEKDQILRAFDRFERSAEKKTPTWLQALRKGGIAHFAELGFPTVADEEWRFTNVAPISRMPFRLTEGSSGNLDLASLERFLFPELGEKRVVLVDGEFHPELSSKSLDEEDGVRVISLAAATDCSVPILPHFLGRHVSFNENSFAALNTAFIDDGIVVIIPRGHAAAEPIHILHIVTARSENAFVHPRILVVAEKGCQAKIIEHYASLRAGPGVTNSVTELTLGEDAFIEHCKIQAENSSHFHVATLQSQQGRGSRLLSHSISTGAALARNNIHCLLDGEGIECTLNGLYLGCDSQVVDHHTSIYHNQPRCNSHEYYHGILDGRALGVFNGKIFVRPEAQKTDAKQTNRNLLLSNEATVHTKPQLEIFADDVRCTHGATIGQLDLESIFYLRARGIGIENARRMLLHAFASEIVNRITLAPVRERLDSELFERYER